MLERVLKNVGGRFDRGKKKRELYQLGYIDATLFLETLARALAEDDPRFHGLAFALKILGAWAPQMKPADKNMPIEEYMEMGMEKYEDHGGKLPMPDAHIAQVALDILNQIENPQ